MRNWSRIARFAFNLPGIDHGKFPLDCRRPAGDDILLRIEGVNDPIITHSQPIAVMPFQTMMRKNFEPQSHLVNLRFDARPDIGRQLEESGIARFAEPRSCSRLAHARTDSPGHFMLGFLDGGFKFGREFQVILNHVVEQITNLTKFEQAAKRILAAPPLKKTKPKKAVKNPRLN
jgi:hypothetical protein